MELTWRRVLCAFLALFTIVMVPVLIAESLEAVGSTEVALSYDEVEKKLSSKILTEGLQTKPTFGSLIKWPTVYISIDFAGDRRLKCNTKDGVELALHISFQYNVHVQHVHRLTLLYKDFDEYDRIIQWRARSSMRHACARFTAREFQTMRSLVPASMHEEVEVYIAPLNAGVIEVQLVDINRPSQYESVVRDKEAAVADIELARNQREQQLVSAQTALLLAEQKANITIDSARTEASILLRRAQADVEATRVKFEALKDVYTKAMRDQNLSSDGIMSFIGSRLVGDMEKINLKLDAPAKTSYRSDL